MSKKHIAVIIAVICLFCTGFLSAVGTKEEITSETTAVTPVKIESKTNLEYAEGFSVDYYEGFKIVTVASPWPGADTAYRYALTEQGSVLPEEFSGLTRIQIPVKSVVTMSTTYLPQLEMLGVGGTLVGHDALQNVYSPAIRERIEDGEVKETGGGPNVNVELLIELDPDLVIAFGSGGEWDVHPKLEEAGLPVVLDGDYVETSPLARSEWIKFAALFFNKEERAAEIFNGIKEEYTKLADRAAAAVNKATVFANTPWSGSWGVPGGESYMADFFRDAGGSYLWADTEDEFTIFLDFEAVYEKAAEADFWLNLGYGWTKKEDALAADSRFADFKAFKEGNLYHYIKRTNEFGANDYWESGLMNPQKILADIIKIFHPELLPDYELYYYRKLD